MVERRGSNRAGETISWPLLKMGYSLFLRPCPSFVGKASKAKKRKAKKGSFADHRSYTRTQTSKSDSFVGKRGGERERVLRFSETCMDDEDSFSAKRESKKKQKTGKGKPHAKCEKTKGLV